MTRTPFASDEPGDKLDYGSLIVLVLLIYPLIGLYAAKSWLRDRFA